MIMKTREEIISAISDVLVEEFECDRAALKPEARLFEDLDLDSIDAVDLIVRLQNQTQLKVKAEDFKAIRTLGDVADVILKLMAEQAK